MPRTRRTYTPEFKVEAVKLVTEQGYSAAEAARSPGLSENLLRNRKQALLDKGEQAFPGQGNLPAIEQELAHLRAENKRLLAERDILKKAAPFFARGAPGPAASSPRTGPGGPSACSVRRWVSAPPATTPGGNDPQTPSSNGTTLSSWRSGPSTPRSSSATAARACTPS